MSVNAITFDYRANVYHIRRAGQPEERAAMNPRAAAHLAVILAAAGWQIDHVGLIPEPTASDEERLIDLVVVAPNIVQMHTQRQPEEVNPAETVNLMSAKDTMSVLEAAEFLGITRGRIYQLAATGTLPSERFTHGRKPYVLLSRAGVMDYHARKTSVSSPSAEEPVSVADQTHTVAEAASLLYMSVPLVYKHIQSGQLKAERIRPNGFGRWQYRIKNADLLTFADEVND